MNSSNAYVVRSDDPSAVVGAKQKARVPDDEGAGACAGAGDE
jgi:hypothetical protein